jgi:arylformamidase
MELFDISVPLHEGMVTYPGDPEVHMERVDSIAEGDAANLTRLDFGVHSGTHVDAPAHFIDGAAGVDALPLDVFLGPCEVVDATTANGEIGPDAIARLPDGTVRVLFKTRNSELWARDEFAENFVSLGVEAAKQLVERGVRLVGMDYLSVGNPDTHRALLGAGVVAIEGLDLRGVEPGGYRLVCFPLRIVGSDGGPARAVLMRG